MGSDSRGQTSQPVAKFWHAVMKLAYVRKCVSVTDAKKMFTKDVFEAAEQEPPWWARAAQLLRLLSKEDRKLVLHSRLSHVADVCAMLELFWPSEQTAGHLVKTMVPLSSAGLETPDGQSAEPARGTARKDQVHQQSPIFKFLRQQWLPILDGRLARRQRQCIK